MLLLLVVATAVLACGGVDDDETPEAKSYSDGMLTESSLPGLGVRAKYDSPTTITSKPHLPGEGGAHRRRHWCMGAQET